MTFDSAVSIVRKEFPNRLIWSGFEYENKYIFAIALDNNFVPNDAALSFVYVDKSTGNTGLYQYWTKIFTDEKLIENSEKAILIDVTKEQINY